jgi:uncharacterized membrane protein
MNANKGRVLINGLAISALFLSLLVKNDILSSALVMACMIGALIVLCRNLAEFSNVSEGNPKLKTVRFVTGFNILFIAAAILVVILMEKDIIVFSDSQSKYFMAAVLAFLIILFGNIAPKLPFNRYTGLRLPWTVRDEDTWIVAHRILGYLSLPLGIVCFVGATVQMPFDTWIKVWFLGPLLIWIGVPSLLSGLFYYKKWNGKL